MKKKKIIAIILIAAAILIIGGTAFAYGVFDFSPQVIFDAKTCEFSFKNAPIGEDGYPDLFNIRNAMPGDSFSWNISVKVKNAGDSTVKVYVIPDSANSEYQEAFLETENDDTAPKLTATFELDTASHIIPTRIRNLYSTGELGEYVGFTSTYLGAFKGNNDEKIIDMTFSLPLEAGNEYADMCAEVDWIFLAEVINGERAGDITPHFRKEHLNYIIGYPDGTVRPEANITRAEAAEIVFRCMAEESHDLYWSTQNAYTDVSSKAWYAVSVSTLTRAGIIYGYPDGTFRPNNSITRAEFTALMCRFFEKDVSGENVFSDISGHWAEEEILTAANKGLVYGYPDGTFRPNEYITRAEAATLVNRAIGCFPDKDHLDENMIRWPDNMNENKWYYEDMQAATNNHQFKAGANGLEYQTQTLEPIDWTAYEKQKTAEFEMMEQANVYRSDEQ